jgi:hypothetical protein
MQSDLNAATPIKHPMREILYRMSDPALVLDTTIRGMTTIWDLMSPSEFSRSYRKIRSHTMCSNARLRGLYRGVKYVVNSRIPGDLVECGCAQGGSAALMALTLAQANAQRRLWLFDTFAGLPAPTLGDPDFEIADLFTGTCVGTVAEVRGLFQRLSVDKEVRLVQGLFQDTMPSAEIRQIALLHIDGDWYESVKACLENLFDKVVPGGIVQFDDYGYWQGARKAVDEFFAKRGIKVALQKLDYSGRFLIKPS